MTDEETAKGFLARFKEWTEETKEAYQALSSGAKQVFERLHTASFFSEENALVDRRKEHASPSGEYLLKVTPYSTGKGTWAYTQGLVYRKGSEEPLAEIPRNYSSFPFLFIEGHPNGHSYLVCGEDYQGQTVIELDTGKRRNFLPEAAEKGFGFCWADYRFDAASRILIVGGCYWACPYEYRFFDFSDPMNGWPELTYAEGAWDDDRWPEVQSDGTIKIFQTWDDDDEDNEDDPKPLAAYRILRREGLELVVVDEWVSDKEQKRRTANEEANQRYEKEIEDFRANDPLYLACQKGLKDSVFSPGSFSVGITYSGWCPDFQGRERRWCVRLIDKSWRQPYTIDLEWAEQTGPVKLIIYKNGNTFETKFFPEHSVESLNQAFAYAKGILQ